jgi:hypothetical protein
MLSAKTKVRELADQIKAPTGGRGQVSFPEPESEPILIRIWRGIRVDYDTRAARPKFIHFIHRAAQHGGLLLIAGVTISFNRRR